MRYYETLNNNYAIRYKGVNVYFDKYTLKPVGYDDWMYEVEDSKIAKILLSDVTAQEIEQFISIEEEWEIARNYLLHNDFIDAKDWKKFRDRYLKEFDYLFTKDQIQEIDERVERDLLIAS